MIEVKFVAGFFGQGDPYFMKDMQSLYNDGWRITYMTQGENKIIATLEREIDD